MRIELELIQKIEMYLMGTLSPNDKTNFESEMNQNSNLKQNVELQKSLMQGIERMALKSATQAAYQSYKLQSFLTKLVVIVVIVVGVITATVLYWPKAESNNTSLIEPEILERLLLDETDSLYCLANEYLYQELFEISADRDTVIESSDGVVVFIPANSFETKNAKVNFVIQTALNPQDIIYSGLNTITKEGDTLETGGMFYFDAFADGKRVALIKELTVDIPASSDNKDMKLYDGEKTANGEIVWTNPKELRRPLTPVDIVDLDFYPPGYEAQMDNWGYYNKDFRDSMYYSFALDCGTEISNGNNVLSREAKPVEIISANSPTLMFMPITPQSQGNQMPGSFDDVIDWKNSSEYLGNGEYLLTFAVVGKDNWSVAPLYSDDSGITTTKITFDKNADVQFIGDGKGETMRDFNSRDGVTGVGDVTKYFRYRVRVSKPVILRGTTDFMVCNGGSCFPPSEGTFLFNLNHEGQSLSCIGVDPASVHAIWNRKFNKTNLATKEFEERMPWIHKTCNNDILELYIHNLDLDLSLIDSMAVKMSSGSLKQKFSEFAGRKDGSVEATTKSQIALNEYYNKKRKALQEAVRLTNAKFWKTQDSLDMALTTKQKESNENAQKSNEEVYQKELKFNTDKVYSDLGMQKSDQVTPRTIVLANNADKNLLVANNINAVPQSKAIPVNASRPIFRTNVNGLGWKNVDCLLSASANRQDVIIQGNGKTTALNYSDWEMSIENAAQYDRINVYAIPREFNSYLKIQPKDGKYKYKLNDQLNYQTVVLAWNEDGLYYHQSETKPGNTSVQLKKTTKENWDKAIKSSLSSINNMSDELDFAEFAQNDIVRNNVNKFRTEQRAKIRAIVFPCEAAVWETDSTDASLKRDTEAVHL